MLRRVLVVVPIALLFIACGTRQPFQEDPDGGDGGILGGQTCDACVCQPGGTTCVANEVHECSAEGQPGKLIKQCNPGAGEVCFGGACVPACQAAEAQPSNVGCEFWAVDLDNEYSQFNDAAGAPWGVVLSNAGEAPANVTIERNDAPPGQPLQTAVVATFTIPARQLKQQILPTREVDGSSMGKDEGPGTFVSSNAYRITSSVPLVVYQFNTMAQSFSNDASLLLPRNALGLVHRVVTAPPANPIAVFPTPGIPDHSFVTIIGTAPQTKVTVVVSSDIVAGSGIPATKKGGTITATLGPFDVLNVESDGIPGDLTGSIVESSAPVAVFSGAERGIVPFTSTLPPAPPDYDPQQGHCCTDHLEDQMWPVTSMGRKFVVTRSPVRSRGWVEPDILRFLGIAKPALVKTNLPPPDDMFTVNPGQTRDTYTFTDFVATSSEPIMIAQLLVSQGFTYQWDPGGDPSLTVFPPLDQYRRDYLFLVPSSWAKNFVVLSVPSGGTVTIDGQPLPTCVTATAGTVDTVAYDAQRCPISEGAHRISGTKPFGVVAYGYGPVGSYAFVGGADVKKIYEPPPLPH
jgi:hypothetical protein